MDTGFLCLRHHAGLSVAFRDRANSPPDRVELGTTAADASVTTVPSSPATATQSLRKQRFAVPGDGVANGSQRPSNLAGCWRCGAGSGVLVPDPVPVAAGTGGQTLLKDTARPRVCRLVLQVRFKKPSRLVPIACPRCSAPRAHAMPLAAGRGLSDSGSPMVRSGSRKSVR